MTVGAKVLDQASRGYYRSRTWNGGDDPVNRRAEMPYTSKNLEAQSFYVEEIRNGSVYAPGSLGYCAYGLAVGLKPTMDGDYQQKLLSGLQDKIKGHDFNAGMAFAEVEKTLNSVVGLSVSLIRSFSAFARGDLSSATRYLASALSSSGKDLLAGSVRQRAGQRAKRLQLSDVPGQYLAYRYAWEPLVKDIYAGAEWLAQRFDPPRTMTAKARVVQVKDGVEFSSNLTAYGSFPARVTISHEIRVEWVEVLSTARSLGLTNPIGILWERVPLSFVVDWFIPLGSYFDNLSFFSGLQMRYGRSVKTLIEARKKLTPCKSAYWSQAFPQWPHSYYCHPLSVQSATVSHAEKNDQPCTYRISYLDRTIGTSLPVPPPDFKSLEKAFSTRHTANAAAMISSALASFIPPDTRRR